MVTMNNILNSSEVWLHPTRAVTIDKSAQERMVSYKRKLQEEIPHELCHET